jgi:hypothetical protein
VDTLVGLGWNNYRDQYYPMLRGKKQKLIECPVCHEHVQKLIHHLKSKISCVPGKEQEINWQLVRQTRMVQQFRNGAVEYAGCQFCQYPIAIWHTEKKANNFDVFKVHMEANVCRAMVGKSSNDRELSATILMNSYTSGALPKYSQKTALDQLDNLKNAKDQYDKFSTFEEWVKAGCPHY